MVQGRGQTLQPAPRGCCRDGLRFPAGHLPWEVPRSMNVGRLVLVTTFGDGAQMTKPGTRKTDALQTETTGMGPQEGPPAARGAVLSSRRPSHGDWDTDPLGPGDASVAAKIHQFRETCGVRDNQVQPVPWQAGTSPGLPHLSVPGQASFSATTSTYTINAPGSGHAGR